MERSEYRRGDAWKRFPLLTALEDRGPFLCVGEPLSFLRVEARGGTLFIAKALYVAKFLSCTLALNNMPLC